MWYDVFNRRSYVRFTYYSMKKVGVSVSQPSGFSPNLVGVLSGRRFLSFREGIIARKKSGLQSGTRRDLVGNPSGFSRDIVGPTK